MPEQVERRRQLSLSAAIFALAAPLFYMGQRIFEHLDQGPVNPLGIVYEKHTSFYWRCAIALWLGSVLAFAAGHWLRRRRVEEAGLKRWAQMLRAAALPFALLVTLLAWVFP